MKVLQIISKKETAQGGPYQVANSLIKEALKIEKKITTNTLSLASISYFNFLYPQKLYYFLNKYNLIHIHEIWSFKILLLSIFIRRLGIPYIIMPHGVLNNWSLKKNFLLKVIYAKLFLRNFFKKAYVFHFLNNEENIDAKKIIKFRRNYILPNALDCSKYLKKKSFKKKGKINILFFGRLHRKKGINEILESISYLKTKKKCKFFNFNFVGPISKEDSISLLKKIDDLNINNLVNIFPEVKDIKSKNRLFLINDVFILPSFDEADSLSIKEAIASGMTILVSKNCKVRISDDFCFYTKVDSINIAKNLIKIYAKRKKFNKYSFLARKFSKKEFDIVKFSKIITQIYYDCFFVNYNSKYINIQT
jgi:glycosyltransferase involved in cell wall biosynthesis